MLTFPTNVAIFMSFVTVRVLQLLAYKNMFFCKQGSTQVELKPLLIATLMPLSFREVGSLETPLVALHHLVALGCEPGPLAGKTLWIHYASLYWEELDGLQH